MEETRTCFEVRAFDTYHLRWCCKPPTLALRLVPIVLKSAPDVATLSALSDAARPKASIWFGLLNKCEETGIHFAGAKTCQPFRLS